MIRVLLVLLAVCAGLGVVAYAIRWVLDRTDFDLTAPDDGWEWPS